MSKPHKILTNEFLMINIISYLTPKDLSCVSQLNSKFYSYSSKFNLYWQNACEEYFCCGIDDELDTNTDISIKRKYSTSKINNNSSSKLKDFCWKKHLGIGIQIKQNYDSLILINSQVDTMFQEELSEVKTVLYSGIKEFLSLPKLRKELLYIESSSNSSLQIYLFDYLYDQQDLYLHYDKEFIYNNIPPHPSFASIPSSIPIEIGLDSLDSPIKENENLKKVNFEKGQIEVKSEFLFFEGSLRKIGEFVKEFKTKKERDALFNLRRGEYNVNHTYDMNYNSENNNLTYGNNLSSIITKTPNKLKSIFYTNNSNYNSNSNNIELEMNKQYSISYSLFSENEISLDNIKAFQEGFSNNKLLYLVHSIILSVTHFCKTTFFIINHLKANDNKILLVYIRKYKEFVDFSCYFNEQMENINVMINYLYDYFFYNRPIFAKFSFLKMFISIWNREVLSKFKDYKSDNQLIETITKIYSSELNIRFQYDLIYKNNIINASSTVNTSADCKRESVSFKKIHFSNEIHEVNNEKNDKIDDFYSNSSLYIVEQALSILSDSGIHEYSVFKLNHSIFSPISKYISDLISKIIKINNEFYSNSTLIFQSKSFSYRIISFIRGFLSNFVCFPFIKRTLSLNLIEHIVKSLYNLILETNKTVNFSVSFKEFDDFLSNFDCNSLSFLQNSIPEIYKALEEIKIWKNEVVEQDYCYSDKQIEKELARRNIPIGGLGECEVGLSIL